MFCMIRYTSPMGIECIEFWKDRTLAHARTFQIKDEIGSDVEGMCVDLPDPPVEFCDNMHELPEEFVSLGREVTEQLDALMNAAPTPLANNGGVMLGHTNN